MVEIGVFHRVFARDAGASARVAVEEFGLLTIELGIKITLTR